jgi:hypothetical protein
MKTARIKDGYGIVQREIMTDEKVDVFGKAIYSLLVSYAGEKQSCYPSLKTICENLKISKPTVIKGIKQLIERGFLVADKRKTKLGEHEANIYFPMYIMDEGVVKDIDYPVKDIYQGSKGDLPPVVKEVDTKINILKINNEDNNIGVFGDFGLKPKKAKKEKGCAQKENGENERSFMVFWNLYANKIGIAESRKAWAKIDFETQQQIIKIVPDWKKYRDARISLPYPATFLNNRRWEDEIQYPKLQPLNKNISVPDVVAKIFIDYYDEDYYNSLPKSDRIPFEKHLFKLGWDAKYNGETKKYDWVKINQAS